MRSVWPNWEGGNLIRTTDAAGAQTVYTYDTEGQLLTVTDALNNVKSYTYDAFGNLISGTNPLLFGFTGKAFDTSTNLQNNINRWYDATIDRWLSVDPIGFEGNDANLYRYVLNNSIKFIDTIGLKGVKPVTIIIWNDTDIYRRPDLAFCMSFKNAASYYMNSPIIEGKKMPIPASQVKEHLCNLSTGPYCVKTVIVIDHGNMAGSQLFQNQLMEKADDLLEALGNVLCEHTRIRFLLLGCGVGIKNHPEDIPPTARELIDRFSPLPNGKTRKVIVQGYPRRVDTFMPGRSGKESGRGASINTFPNPYSK
ncbi:MAG: RHS repeat-associated core domain-containing protein [Thermoguttaceae bacterium]|nr:RHS repeat-associated core domain-containing protein [Thermoguttaceae bacterium]